MALIFYTNLQHKIVLEVNNKDIVTADTIDIVIIKRKFLWVKYGYIVEERVFIVYLPLIGFTYVSFYIQLVRLNIEMTNHRQYNADHSIDY